MQLRLDQLEKHLQKQLATVYLLSGEIPLLMQEASDMIRKSAVQAGFTEREVLQIDASFNWSNFSSATQSLSLFSSKQLLELRLTTALGETGSKALQYYLERPDPNKLLLIVSGKLDAKAQKSTWLQAINKLGVVIQIWPIELIQLPAWIEQRLKQAGLQADRDGIQLLVEAAEGNLLACAQEIEKLKLIYNQGNLTTEVIAKVVGNSTRFDVFNLVDASLRGESKRTIIILHSLKNEGIEAIIVLWALTRELRSLASMAQELSQNLSLEKILQMHHVWEKRKPLIRHALKMHSVKKLHQLLQHAHQIDCIIKGSVPGNAWNELENLSLAMTGNSLHKFLLT